MVCHKLYRIGHIGPVVKPLVLMREAIRTPPASERATGGALNGIRVLDLARILSGPYAVPAEAGISSAEIGRLRDEGIVR
jgi:hypothetical protein